VAGLFIFSTSGICYCNALIPSPPFFLLQWFFCYDNYTITVRAPTLRTVQSVWSKMHKNPVTIGVVCDSFINSELVSKNSRHTRYTWGAQFGNHCPSDIYTVTASSSHLFSCLWGMPTHLSNVSSVKQNMTHTMLLNLTRNKEDVSGKTKGTFLKTIRRGKPFCLRMSSVSHAVKSCMVLISSVRGLILGLCFTSLGLVLILHWPGATSPCSHLTKFAWASSLLSWMTKKTGYSHLCRK
jgi:hypothetical protein